VKLTTHLYLAPGLKITVAVSVSKLFPFTTVKVHKSGLAKLTSVSRWKAVQSEVLAAASVFQTCRNPLLPFFSELTVRNQSRVSFGVKETANLLWCSHLISSEHFFTTLNVITNVLLFSTSHMELRLTTSAAYLKNIQFKFLT
jgi:hypothetical protein